MNLIVGGNEVPTNKRPAPKKLTFLGWGVFLLALYAWNGTNTGHEVLFYGMVLIVLFLFIYNYQAILKVLTK